MPFDENLPPQGTNPYYAPLVAAWSALKAFVNSLETSLAAKLNTSTYTTGMASKADLVNGVIPNSQIPPLAIGQPFPVASQAAMLALTAQRGDIAIRSDVLKTFILSTDSPSTLGDWLEMSGGTGGVTSVAGKAGIVILVKADVGLGNVDNTSDASKPVSTAQSTALLAKANLASPIFTGDPRTPTPDAADNDTSIPNTAWVRAAIAAGGGGGGGGSFVYFDSATSTWPDRPITTNPVGWVATKSLDAGRPAQMVDGDYIFVRPGSALIP